MSDLSSRSNVESLFRDYLLSGERILWTGRPKQGFAVSGADAFLIPLSILWLGFVIAWNIGVSAIGTADAPIFFWLFGLLFLLLGLYLTFGRFIHDRIIRRGQYYAVTDQRVMLLRRFPNIRLQSMDIDRLPALELQEHGAGHGTLRFEPRSSSFSLMWGSSLSLWLPSASIGLGFFKIADARTVYQLIRRQGQIGRPAS